MNRYTWAGLRLGMATLALSGSLFATSIFSDQFPDAGANAEPLGLGLTNGTLDLRNWDVLSGSVDVLDTFLGVNCGSPSGKRCVDINGSTNVAGRIQTTSSFTFQTGRLYTLTLWVSGSQRTGSDTMRVSLGNLGSSDVTLAAAAPWQQVTIGGFLGNGSTGRIVIDGAYNGPDSDNIGIVFDDVNLDETIQQQQADTPEPATLALIGAGLALIGWRRKQ